MNRGAETQLHKYREFNISDDPDVKNRTLLVDTSSMVKDPKRFEIVVTSNLFSDILIDLGAAIAGLRLLRQPDSRLLRP